MLNPQELLQIRCRFEALITEREAMIAGNKRREMKGERLTYDAEQSQVEQFYMLAEKMKKLGDQLRDNAARLWRNR